VVEDYTAEERTLVQRLATTLNSFLEQASAAVNGNLTLKDNIKSKIYSSELSAGTTVKTVVWDLNERPSDIRIARLVKKDGTSPSAAFSLSWEFTPQGLQLTFIGLDALTSYRADVIAQV